jgi:hypothetical protein
VQGQNKFDFFPVPLWKAITSHYLGEILARWIFVRPLLCSTVVLFDQCFVWPLLCLTVALFNRCFVWPLFYLTIALFDCSFVQPLFCSTVGLFDCCFIWPLLCSTVSNRQTRGQCYDHYCSSIFANFLRKNGAFPENQCNIFCVNSRHLSQNRPFLLHFSGENILKFITLVPAAGCSKLTYC